MLPAARLPPPTLFAERSSLLTRVHTMPCQLDCQRQLGTALCMGAMAAAVTCNLCSHTVYCWMLRWHLFLKLAPKPPSDRLVERAGRKPEADRRLYERLRSVDDAARDSAAGASGCRKQGARPCQTC